MSDNTLRIIKINGRNHYSDVPIKCEDCYFHNGHKCVFPYGEDNCYYRAPGWMDGSFDCDKLSDDEKLTKKQEEHCTHCQYYRKNFRYRVCQFARCPFDKTTCYRKEPLKKELVVGVALDQKKYIKRLPKGKKKPSERVARYYTFLEKGKRYYSDRPLRCNRCHFYTSNSGCVFGVENCYYLAPSHLNNTNLLKGHSFNLKTTKSQKEAGCSNCKYYRPEFKYRVCHFARCPYKKTSCYREKPTGNDKALGMDVQLFIGVKPPEVKNDQVFSIWKQG